MEEIVNPFKKKYKYASHYGFILAGYIAVFFILDYLFPKNVISGTLETIGLLGTPIICYYLAYSYRNKAWGGYIHFGQVWSFGVWLFLFASLLMAVLYYIRFQFLEPDYISNQYNQTLIMVEDSKLFTKEYLDQAASTGAPNAIQTVLGYIWIYVIGGAVLFLFISPIVSRKRPDDTTDLSADSTEKPYEPYQDKNDSNKSQS